MERTRKGEIPDPKIQNSDKSRGSSNSEHSHEHKTSDERKSHHEHHSTGQNNSESHEDHESEHHHDDHPHHPEIFEAVIGSTVAAETKLKLGSAFVATHGIQENSEGEKHDHSPWQVVGILEPTGTPCDRAIYINLDSFYHIEGHVIEQKPSHNESPSQEPDSGQISSLALKAKSPILVWGLRKEINNRNDTQATVPAEEIRKLLTIVGNVDRILLAQALLVVVVSALGTGLALYNSMNERRRDIGIMRALGARRGTIVSIVVGEAVLIAGMGGILGLGLGHGIVHLANPAIQTAVGFMIPAWNFHTFDLWALIGALFVGFISGIGPAIAAYRTDVATALSS
jgi:putative ABC transport system permease protein